MTERNDDPIYDIRVAIVESCCKTGLLKDGKPLEIGDFLSLVVSQLPDFFRQPLQPVPEPLPWLDQPDGVGLFWFIDESKPKNAPWLIDIDPNGDGSPLCYRTGSEEFDYLDDLKGRWQRIPKPVLPGEGGE